MNKSQPYSFHQQLHRSFGAAKIVLGPYAIRRLLATILELPTKYGTPEMGGTLACVLELIDPTQQLVIHTGKDGTSHMDIKLEPVQPGLGKGADGYTLVDISGAVAAAVKEDLTGVILQCIQLHWERDLNIEDAEKISEHLEELIKLIK